MRRQENAVEERTPCRRARRSVSFNTLSEQRPAREAARLAYQRSPGLRVRYTALRAIAAVAIILLGALMFANALVAPVEAPTYCTPSRFIIARGSALCANGHPLSLIGYNWHWVGAQCQAPTDALIEQTFSQIQSASHANVVRTAFYQSGSGGGSYVDFDRYIAAARRHHLYILPMLANQWTNCEPSRTAKTAAWYQRGYKLAGGGYPLSYRQYVRNLVSHYANEPTIAFWQLVNEPDAPGAGCGASAAHTLRTFADDMAAVIKSVDPHHLVDLGAPGTCAADNPTDYQTIVSGSVQVADVWHDYNQPLQPAPALLWQRIQVLQKLHKPAFVGESGICANVRTDGVCAGAVSRTSLARRASFFDAKLAAAFHVGLSGYIIWSKASQSIQNDIGPGDPTESVLAKYTLAPPVGAATGSSWTDMPAVAPSPVATPVFTTAAAIAGT